MTYAAIPTEYAGVRFRSRLEARWAAFFDNIGARWQYEPVDLVGYIPDFLVDLPAPLLIEVKPAARSSALLEAARKIDASGWRGEAWVVGLTPSIGLARWRHERDHYDRVSGLSHEAGTTTWHVHSLEEFLPTEFATESAWRKAGNATQYKAHG